MTVLRRQLCTLRAFRSYFRLLKTFNRESFAQRSQLMKIILCACAMTIGLTSLTAVTVLAIWKVADEQFEMKIVCISLPLVISLIEQILVFFVLTWKNRSIDKTVRRLQAIISDRKWHLLFQSFQFESDTNCFVLMLICRLSTIERVL